MKSCRVQDAPNFFRRKLKHLYLEDTYLPQLLEGPYSVESFTFHNNINRYILLSGTICCVGYGIFCVGFVTFGLLKSLSLGGVLPHSNRSLETIVSKCDQLQNLSLTYCYHLTYLRITSMTLDTLSIKSSIVDQLKCEINAPSLISFNFEGPKILFSRVTASYQLAAELFVKDTHDLLAPLKGSNLQHYQDVFKEARLLKLSNLFTECVFTAEAQFAAHSLHHLPEMKVSANLGKSCYKKFLLEVLSMASCHTSLSLNFEQDPFPLFGNASASLDLKFHDGHRQGVIILQNENHDCIKDHLYEISVQIRKGDRQIISLLKFLLVKALHLKKVVVQFNVRVSADSR